MPPQRITTMPWVVSGFVTHAIVEIIGIAFAVVAGRLTLSTETLAAGAMFTVGVGILGALVGLLFARFHHKLSAVNIIYRGVIAFAVETIVLQLLTGGPASFLSFDFVFSLVVTAAMGAVFVLFGLRLGGF